MSYDHEWLVCERCGEPQMLRPEKKGRLCHMTPACDGHVWGLDPPDRGTVPPYGRRPVIQQGGVVSHTCPECERRKRGAA